MKDKTALAYVNMFAILGAIPELCRIDEKAGELIKDSKISLGFSVKGGPCATLIFKDGACSIKKGLQAPTVLLPFSSPEKFNGMIDGTVTPIPSKGFLHLGFLLKKFTAITDILESYLRPDASKLASDEEFYRASTVLMLGVIARAVCALGNHDKVSRASASYIVDGNIRISIADVASATVNAKNGTLRYVMGEQKQAVTSYMEFKDVKTARQLFDGELNAVAAVGMGDVRIGGMVSQVDNVNRILDRVAYYLV